MNEGLIASVCLDCVLAKTIISWVSPPQYRRMNQLPSCYSLLLAVLGDFFDFETNDVLLCGFHILLRLEQSALGLINRFKYDVLT
jgi:hypothetical protein